MPSIVITRKSSPSCDDRDQVLIDCREGFVQQYISKMVARSLEPGHDDIIKAPSAKAEQKNSELD